MISGGTPDEKRVLRDHGNRRTQLACDGSKAPYTSLRVAKSILARTKNKKGAMEIYRCKRCSAYHVGHRAKVIAL